MENDNDDVEDKTDFKQNLTGYVYQLKLLLLFLWRGLKKGKCNKFQLGTELKEAEKFDDAIFFYEKAAKIYVRYMQAKYSRFDKKVLEFKDFESGWSRARCNLKKYFISYRKIKQRPYQAEIDDLIICTNIPFEKLSLKKNATNELTFDDVSGGHDEIFYGMKKYQLKDITTAPKIRDELKQCTNLNLLAKELVNCVFKNTKGYNFDLQDYWISSYFNALIKEKVIEEREYYKLFPEIENPQNNTQLLKNQEIQEFRKYYFKKTMEKEGMINENVRFDPNFIDRLRNHKKGTSATLEEIAEILLQYTPNNTVPLTLPNRSFDKMNNIVKKEQSFYFTEKFISNSTDISQNAKAFRIQVIEACEKEVAKNLAGQEIFATDALNGIKNFASTKWSATQIEDEEEVAKEMIQHIFFKKTLIDLFNPKYALLKDVFNLTGMNTLQFTKDFAKNNNGNFRKIFLKLFAEEKLKNTTIKFKQDTTKFSLIINQLKKSYDTAEAKKTKILKFDQTNWKKEKMEGLIEALNGSIFIATNERDKIEFKDIFMGGFLPNKLAERFKTDLKVKFQNDFTNLKDFKIEYTNYPPHFDQLTEESTPINDDIEKFCEKLFIVNTPSETELMKSISNEMGETFNLLDGDTITFSVFQEVMNWAKEKEDLFLKFSDAKLFMDTIGKKLSQKFEVGCSLQYMNKLKEYHITYNNNLGELITFLNMATQNKIFHIETNEILLTAIKVFQTLQYCENLGKKDYLIFNPLTSLIRMENDNKHVSKSFGSTTDLLIIVDKEVENGFEEFCNILLEIIKNKPNKKIVIISHGSSQLVPFLTTQMTHGFIKAMQNKITFDDLTPESKNIILQNNKICFQGNDVLLNKFLTGEEASELIDAHTLEKIIIGEKITVGEPVQTCAEIENGIYRPRQIRLIEIDDTIFEGKNLPKNNLIVVEVKEVPEILKTQNISDKIIYVNDFLTLSSDSTKTFIIINESQSAKQFQQICEKYPDYCIHWLKNGCNKFVWFYSHIPTSMKLSAEFKNSIRRQNEYIHESFFEDYIKQNRVVIIADTAGMGKSTILTKFSKTLKTEEQWILKINLNQYTPILLKMQRSLFKNDKQLHLNFDNLNPKKIDYGKLILQSLITPETRINGNPTFENQVFNHFFTKRGILYMFDGFDEINPDYGDIVLNLLQLLKKNNKNRIWITSRTNFKQTLEDAFDTFAYDMKPFDRNDQEIFFKQYWINNYKLEKGIDMPNQNRIPSYVDELLEEAPRKILQIIGIPLQTKMLAEIFQEKDDDDKLAWVSCYEYVEAENAPVDINISDKIRNIYTLYENFFKEKVVKYFLHEKGIVELSKPFSDELKEFVFSKQFCIHKIFGYLALIDKNEDENLLTEQQKQMTDGWLTNFYKGVENIGIIDSFNSDGHPLFTHLTYAEYFAACFLVDKLCNSSSNAQKVFNAANEIFKKDVPVFEECFLHLLKKEINNKELKEALDGKNIIYFVMTHGFLNCVDVFLSHSDLVHGFSKSELLHIAAESGHIDVVAFITFCIWLVFEDVNEKLLCYFFTDLVKNDYLHVSNYKPEVTKFFADLKKAAYRHVVYKKYPFAEIKYDYELFLRHRNFRQWITSNIHVPRFLKLFSFKNIIIILKVLKIIAFDWRRGINHFVSDICSRNDITDEEKIQIFEAILNEYVEKENMNSVAEEIMKQVIQYNCPELLVKMLAKENLKYDEKFFYQCYTLACNYDHLEIIKELLQHLNTSIKGCSYRWSPLDIAIMTKTRLETIIFLNESMQTSINDVNKALFVAVQSNSNIKIIDYLCAKGADPNVNFKGDSPWTLAVENCNDGVIKYFFSHFENLAFKKMAELLKNYYHDPQNFDWKKNVDRKYFLHQAIEEENIPLCKFLIQKGANIHLKDSKGFTALELAREEKLDEIVELLIVYGASAKQFFERLHSNPTILPFDEKKDFKETYLEFFGKTGGFENNLRKINKAKINQKDKNGNTLLHLAAKHDDGNKVVIGLLERGAFYNLENNNKETPESVASPLNKSLLNKIDECFRNAKQKKFIFKEDPLLPFLKQRDIAVIKNKKGRTLLHYAVKMNIINAVETLLDFNADINEADNKNRTPVFYSVKNNNIKMLKLLLKYRRIDIPMVYGGQGYDKIEKNKCKKMIVVIEKCLNHIFNEEIEEIKRELNYVKNNYDFNVILNINGVDWFSITKYSLKCPKFLLYLLQKGAIVDMLKSAANFDLFVNSKIKNILSILIKIADYVQSKKFTPESIINYYECHFIDAVSYITTDKKEINKIISNVRFDRDPFDFERCGFAYLRYDIVYKQEEKIAINGRTLLHSAAIVDDKEIAEWLINEKNADPNLKDHDGNNVYDLAKKYNSQNVLALLEQQQKDKI